jgi:hypothetical protein
MQLTRTNAVFSRIALVSRFCAEIQLSVKIREKGLAFFPDRLPLCRHYQKPRFGTRNSVLAPCQDGDLEEIFIIIITDVSPSTIHDSPIHV